MSVNSTATEGVYRRALGAYLGLAVGDALGATVEFMTPDEISESYGTHDRIIGGGWLNLRPGQVTDDTEMSLALGEAIVSGENWEIERVADTLVSWLKSKPIDVGHTCRRGIARYQREGTVEAAPSDGSAGNGACMRNLPVVLSTLDDDHAFITRSLQQCHLTHNHPLSDAATLGLGEMVRVLVRGGSRAKSRTTSDTLIGKHPCFSFEPYPGRASGYIVDTVQTVLDAFFNTDSFESCVVLAVNRGQDADTNGALAGMLAGALYGPSSIPFRWLEQLEVETKSRIVEQTRQLVHKSCSSGMGLH